MLGSLRATAGGNATPIVNSTQAITATSTIAITAGVANQVCPVSSAAAITLTSNPQIATGSNGQSVTIQNVGANAITFTDGNGLGLQGTLVIGSTQFATFVNLGGFWQLESTNGSPVWTAATFQNSFANQGGTAQACEFTRFLNQVFVRGIVTRSGAWSNGTTIFTLPTGLRPGAVTRFTPDAYFVGGAPLIEIQPAGTVTLFIGGASPTTQTVSLLFNFRL